MWVVGREGIRHIVEDVASLRRCLHHLRRETEKTELVSVAEVGARRPLLFHVPALRRTDQGACHRPPLHAAMKVVPPTPRNAGLVAILRCPPPTLLSTYVPAESSTIVALIWRL